MPSETAIGAGYLSSRFLRVTVSLMFTQMLGSMSPIVLNPTVVFAQAPFVLGLEGQYVAKKLVLLAAGVVIGATVRGSR